MARKSYPGERPADWQGPDGEAGRAPARGGLKWWHWVLIVFGGLIVLGALAGDPEPNGGVAAEKGSPSTGSGQAESEPVEPYELTAEQLGNAFENNEVAAQRELGARLPLAVTGTIESITLDFLDEPVVVLSSGRMFQGVHADFDDGDVDAVAALRKGAQVTVVCGALSEVAGTPMLDDCALR